MQKIELIVKSGKDTQVRGATDRKQIRKEHMVFALRCTQQEINGQLEIKVDLIRTK